jgi:hypothetical protein
MRQLPAICFALTLAAIGPVASRASPYLFISAREWSTSMPGSNGYDSFSWTGFNGWDMNVVANVTHGANPRLELTVYATPSTNATDLWIYLSDTGFGPAPGFEANLNGRLLSGTGQSLSYISAFDTGNHIYNPQTTITDSGKILTPGYSSDVFGGPITNNNYSITQIIRIFGTPRDQPVGTYYINATLTVIPEPSALTPITAATIFLALHRRRILCRGASSECPIINHLLFVPSVRSVCSC